MSRKIISVVIATTFLVLATSGLYAFFFGYHSLNIFMHVLFGWIFLAGAIFHLRHNFTSLGRYIKAKSTWIIPGALLFIIILGMTSFNPIVKVKSWYESYQAELPKEVPETYYVYDKTNSLANLEIEVLAGDHFWFPQLAVWLEDTSGNYLETLLVTYSTSHGVFFGGRTKENFKTLDKTDHEIERKLIRVDALPYWSHKRNVEAQDGIFAPHPDNPLPDGISGATPQGNFKLKSSYDSLEKFKVVLEVNVAFDDNEYYSEFDFPEDSVFHSGAGLLGQPSLIYEAVVRPSKKYTLMELIGHGHRSGQNGELNSDLSQLTTATKILERIIIKRVESTLMNDNPH